MASPESPEIVFHCTVLVAPASRVIAVTPARKLLLRIFTFDDAVTDTAVASGEVISEFERMMSVEPDIVTAVPVTGEILSPLIVI